jgi:arsenate reductase
MNAHTHVHTHDKKGVLFLCTGNSCRSQMAEGWARHMYGDTLEMCSAGTAPHGIDPRAVKVMAEMGVDIGNHASNHVNEYLDIPFDLIVTVCDSARELCPVFPGGGKTLHYSFDDPPFLARAAKNEEEALIHYRQVRDEIREFVAGISDLF